MSEKVVYLLGAGFSQPLGLPVMSNFLIKAKELFFGNPNKFREFEEIFTTINELSKIKNFFNADLFNIEEVLSILEMAGQITGTHKAKKFQNFISKVISEYTPPNTKYPKWVGNWYDFIFGQENQWIRYGAFLGGLFNLQFQKTDNKWSSVYNPDNIEYSIITLNYDLVFEKMASRVNDFPLLSVSPKLHFKKSIDDETHEINNGIYFAKLHGSVDTGEIVPPTWNKNVSDKIINAWGLAYHCLKNANHLRIIGYSLPPADAYVKYLIKAGIQETENLKKIDVICLDKDGNTRGRYDDFIAFNYYDFFDVDIESYFNVIVKNRLIAPSQDIVYFNTLEKAHGNFIKQH